MIVMYIASLIGYGLFPLEQGGDVLTFGNFMHLAITAIVLIATVGALLRLAMASLTKNFRGIGQFTLACAIVIVLAGIATPVVLNSDFSYPGLLECLLIFTFQLWIFVLSVYLFRLPKIMDMELKRFGLVEIYKER